MPEHSGIDWTAAVQRQFALRPERYAVMGQYAREMLEIAESPADYMSDTLMVRLSTAVLCGQTVSETPQVELSLPASWRQHLKHKLQEWEYRTERDLYRTPQWRLPPWLWPVRWTAIGVGKWIGRHPVKWTTVTADVHFEQRVLYPEIDAPVQAGRPVVYETLDISYPGLQPPFGSRLIRNPSRFLDQHEIIREILRDPDANDYRYGAIDVHPVAVMKWLERHGVNVDQLVKRQGF